MMIKVTSGRRTTPVVAAVLVAGISIAVVFALLPRRSTYAPVVRPTVLDGWRPPWSDQAAPAEGDCAGLPNKWIVLGWDGASWDIVLPLVENNQLPNLARLMRRGAYGELRTIVPTQSASVWTTIATGVSPARHGITGFAKPSRNIWTRLGARLGMKPKRTELFSNADRRVKAIWNLASDDGKRVLVVGYHNTFPAEKVAGAMVSNYLVRQGFVALVPGSRPEEGSQIAAHLVYPSSLLRTVTALIRPLDRLSHEEVRRFVSISQEEFDRRMAAYRENRRANLQWEYLLKAYAYDAFHARAAEQLSETVRPDLLMLHLQGPDWASHYFLYYHAPERFAAFANRRALKRKLKADIDRYRATLTAFYQYADELLGRLLETQGASTGVMVLSDHGMDAVPDVNETGGHNAGPPGVLILAGPGIRPGTRLAGATVYDILPTLAAAMGLPLAQDLEGRVLREAFCPQSLESQGVRSVRSYQTGARFQPEVELGEGLHQEVERELRGLGYIQ